jgi:hypothetical protein
MILKRAIDFLTIDALRDCSGLNFFLLVNASSKSEWLIAASGWIITNLVYTERLIDETILLAKK